MRQEEFIIQINRDIQAIDRQIEKLKSESILFASSVDETQNKIPIHGFEKFIMVLLTKIKLLLTVTKRKQLLVQPVHKHS